MSHITKEVPWCTIDIDTKVGKIVVVERWRYDWINSPPYRRWTPAEMQAFHQQVQREIWAAWSNRAFLVAAGTSAFAKSHSGRSIPVFMDVRRVLAKHHWDVSVNRVPDGVVARSRTSWWGRRIILDTHDVLPRVRCELPPVQICTTQIPVAHEFGHTIGNTEAFARGDEYEAKSQHRNDVGSMMNWGMELRKRHFDQLLMELNGAIEDTTFTVGRLI